MNNSNSQENYELKNKSTEKLIDQPQPNQGQGQASDDAPQAKSKNLWILYAFGSAFFFTLCNTAISEITSKVGPLCLFYFASGSILTGLLYNLIEAVKNWRNNGEFWNFQNLIIKGKVNYVNLIGFLAFCFVYFLVQNMAFLTMYFSALANMNVGLITTLWSVNPLFMALMDRIMFSEKMMAYHVFGMIFIVICTVMLSLSGVVDPKEPVEVEVIITNDEVLVEDKPLMASWVPVLFGIITPIAFTANGMLTKHLSKHQENFNASTISFSSYLVVNIVVMIFAIPYWCLVEFSPYLFWVGFFGALINTLGLVCVQNALSIGPAGPVSAIGACSNPALVIIEAIRHQQMLSGMEFVALLFGMVGALVLVIPDILVKILCFWKLCYRKDSAQSQKQPAKN